MALRSKLPLLRVKHALKLNLEKQADSKPNGLAAILVDVTLFAGTNEFRSDERNMHDAVKTGVSSDLSDRLLKFGGLEVKAIEDHLVCRQHQYLKQKVPTARPFPSTEISNTLVKKSASNVGWVATITYPHASFFAF